MINYSATIYIIFVEIQDSGCFPAHVLSKSVGENNLTDHAEPKIALIPVVLSWLPVTRLIKRI
jgi:hypothetical protein